MRRRSQSGDIEANADADADRDVVLSATAWAIVDLVKVGYRDIGLAVYRVGREPLRPWRRRLVRVHRVRARRRPTASRVRWAPGKGVIGACVERGQVVAQDLRVADVALGPVTRGEWEALPADIRLGLTFDELADLRDRDDVVVATPVIDDSGGHGEVVGCRSTESTESAQRLTASLRRLGASERANDGGGNARSAAPSRLSARARRGCPPLRRMPWRRHRHRHRHRRCHPQR